MFAAQHIPYNQTNSFSKIIEDYIEQSPALRPFFEHPPTIQGIKSTIVQKQTQAVNRNVLVATLQEQYKKVPINEPVQRNIELLLSKETFTICTAHQPNLFTGPLYFIYKILHTIKLSEDLKKNLPQYHFVPVFYMGSEDADLAELNHIYVAGKKYEWPAAQTGAVGRMVVDKKLIELINELQSQIGTSAYGKEIVQLFHDSYTAGTPIQDATFKLVHALFGNYGLLVLIPDNALLKQQMLPVFEEDIFAGTPSKIVEETSKKLAAGYNVQAHPRAINLFYLKDTIRERIEKKGDRYLVLNSAISYSEEELKQELQTHPERFSPNVILRGLFQETILPNIAFIGGGGELAYWLQLKDLFHQYKITFPVLVLRNSFLIIPENQQQVIKKLGLTASQLFKTELEIINELLEKQGKKPGLNGELDQLQAVYAQLKLVASSIDVTLQQHVEAIKTRTTNELLELEKKMVRAERKKHETTQRQIAKLKEALFVKNDLQERVENISGFYAKWGSGFIDELLKQSLALEQQFKILTVEAAF